jgi:polar amino acid transport system permease protein
MKGGSALNSPDETAELSSSKALKLVQVLVAITAVLSLLYAIQYYAGGPIRLRVVSQIYDLAISPGDSLIATGAQDGLVRLLDVPRRINTSVGVDFDVATEEPWPRRTLSGHQAPVIEVGFVPAASGTGRNRSQSLVSVDRDGKVRVWSVAALPEPGGTSDQAEQVLDLGVGPLLDADLSDDGTTLAVVGEDGAVRVWDLASGQEVQSIGPGDNDRAAVALNADGTLVAAGDGVNVKVWSVETGELVQELVGYCKDEALATQKECEDAEQDWLGHGKEVTALAFNPDGDILASGSADTTIVLWELAGGEVAGTAEGHWAAVTTMVFDQGGAFLLSGSKDGTMKNLRVPGGKSTATYQGHLSAVNSVGPGLQQDTLFSAGDDGTLRTWETSNQYVIHVEWSRVGLQPTWGRTLAAWMLISGLLGLVCVFGLWKVRIWGHLLGVALYLIGPILVLGLPLFEVLSYPLATSVKLQIAWPLIALAIWYTVLLVLMTREKVAVVYAAPREGTLSEQIMVSQQTAKTRFGIYSLAVWLALLVILYSVLRRFQLDIAFMGYWFQFILGGAGLTVLVSAASIALAVVLALFGALGRLSKNPILNGISGFYISLVRGTPLLVQIFIWYLGLPQLGIILEAIPAGILALGVNYGAYMTEIFRAGIQAIGKGQHEAAEALGMSRTQTLRRIVLPQAFRIVIPPIGNEFIAMMKDSSLVYFMGVWELTFRAQKIGRQNFRTMETFIIAAAFYWILTVVFQFLQGKLEDYMARGERR